MKNKVLLVVVLLFALSITKVSATDHPGYAGITIIPSNCVYDSVSGNHTFAGNIDILINIDDYDEEQINNTVSDDYIGDYPLYSSHSHLDNTSWISYYAFYEGSRASYNFNEECDISFAYILNEDKDISRIKVVYFNDDGTTVFTTEEIEIPHEKWYQGKTGAILLDIENETYTSTYELKTDSSIIIFLIILLILAATSATIKLVISSIFKVEYDNYTKLYLISFGMFFVFFFLLMYFGSVVEYIDTSFKLTVFLLSISIIEGTLFTYLVGKKESKLKMIKVTIITYIILILIPFFLFF